MRRESRLGAVAEKGRRRSLLLRSLIENFQGRVTPDTDRLSAFATIEALNLWHLYCRSLYLSSALGCFDSAGNRVTPPGGPISSEGHAITVAVHAVKPQLRDKSGPWAPRDEPPWHDTSAFLKSMQALGPSNLPAVQAALSYPTKVFTYLPTARNFYAHRAMSTAVKVQGIARGYALNPRLRPTELLLTRLPGRPQPLLADWLDDLRLAIVSAA